jgi:hypothetical protein
LTIERAKDLVYVFTNYRVQHNITRVRNNWASIYHRFGKKGKKQNSTDGDRKADGIDEQDKDKLDTHELLFQDIVAHEVNNEYRLVCSMKEEKIDEDFQRLLQEEETLYPFRACEGQKNSVIQHGDSQLDLDEDFTSQVFRPLLQDTSVNHWL